MSQQQLPDIGKTIKQLRSAKGLTLDQLATSSGVSKSMLSQIERNKTNPTVGTLWSLTEALNIDIGDLLGAAPKETQDKQNIQILKSHQTPEIQSADGLCTLRILGPLDLVSKVEWYELNIEKGGILDSEPHTNGTREHLTVLRGSVLISMGDEEKLLEAGDTARYDADVHHYIKNNEEWPAQAILIVHTP
ncbi:helix-turn-helix domain-containing protein [Pseudemcibacter aquimaris]|uniref:helix-turn-helix domain-containing protein n=1 Tax=Pseudemcibacter aquimaris TaxID=2857064 RepID=UPI0020121591|nr:XRE family transcriptional regulator [Pseudemcibacter aquimaris]MCC3861930.1 XRE family transcriptional regulator [Pseudemcibacter aquimaris]WDU58682.1 XRE family transcriptional regulator [Pseudemcibacter aquimaris]